MNLAVHALLCLSLVALASADLIPAAPIEDRCAADLTSLMASYSSPVVYPEGCDAACLAACSETVEQAADSRKSRTCPPQNDIVRCMNVRGVVLGLGEHAVAGFPCHLSAAACLSTTQTPSLYPTIILSSSLQVYKTAWVAYVKKCAFVNGTAVVSV
jgi:hypothetical protein